MKKYRCYLDTNIFLDYIRKRDEDTITFINRATEFNLDLVTSYFTYLELLDKEAEDYFAHKELKNKKTFDEIRRNIYDRNLKKSELKVVLEETTEKISTSKSKNIELFSLYYLNDEGWNLAMDLMSEINIHAGDAVHLATAIQSDCDVLLTKDSYLLNNAKQKIVCMTPKEFMDKIEEEKDKS